MRFNRGFAPEIRSLRESFFDVRYFTPILASAFVGALVVILSIQVRSVSGAATYFVPAEPMSAGQQGAQPLGVTQSGCGPDTSAIASIPRDYVRRYDAPPPIYIDPSRQYVALIQTNRGQISLALDAADAPNTVNNFVFLSCHGFYDGLTFHRVVKTPRPFVIQGGDPNGDGTGGPGYLFADEISPALTHGLGAVSMANAGPNTNGSQFFITLAPQPALDGSYNIFGQVSAGMDIVNAIQAGDQILSIAILEQ